MPPKPLLVAEVHALHDAVIGLFAGARGPRTMMLDPAQGQSTGDFWAPAAGDPTHFICTVAATPELIIGIPLNEGDQILSCNVSLKQVGGGAVTATLWELDGATNNSIATVSTTGATIEAQDLPLAGGGIGLPYTVPANVAVALIIQAGGAVGDAFGGGELTFDHP
jgi:hypothetical protein